MSVIKYNFLVLGAGVFVFCGLVWFIIRFSPSHASSLAVSGQDENSRILKKLVEISPYSEPAFRLLHLVSIDGAGDWPPRCNYRSWPATLLPYRDIYHELNHLLPTADASLDDETNQARRFKYRGLMRKLLSDRIDLAEVEKVLSATENGNWDNFPLDAYNALYCTVAVCRHAYRWAMVPVVKVAQEETMIDFPPELEVPWLYLQRHFGCAADAGNITSNAVHNFDERGDQVYRINVGMPSVIQSSENTFIRIFHDVEVLAFPIYYKMVCVLASYAAGNNEACAKHLESINGRLRDLLRIFYDRMNNTKIARSVWQSYVQGFQGWGVGRVVNGEYVKYDGLSGNQILVFRAVDAFLGLDSYLKDEAMGLYIPRRQRDLCASLRAHSIRSRLCEKQDARLIAEFAKIVSQIRVFRAAHRARIMPYLQQPAPERWPMTAGNSLLGKEGLENALAVLDGLLEKRFNQTV